MPTLAEIQESTLELLAAQLKKIQERQAESPHYVPTLAGMASNLAKAVASITGEVRKREAHARRMVGDMTEDERELLVKAYIAGLTKERRASFRKYLEELE